MSDTKILRIPRLDDDIKIIAEHVDLPSNGPLEILNHGPMINDEIDGYRLIVKNMFTKREYEIRINEIYSAPMGAS